MKQAQLANEVDMIYEVLTQSLSPLLAKGELPKQTVFGMQRLEYVRNRLHGFSDNDIEAAPDTPRKRPKTS